MLTLEKSEAKQLYPQAPDWLKKKMDQEFGAGFHISSIIDRIKTFNDACKEENKTPDQVYVSTDSVDEKAYKKLKLIAKVINEGWEPDWDNDKQKKWYPWFRLSSGFGFSASFYNSANAGTDAGSRLCFESKEKSDYVAKQFIDLYNDLLTL